MGARGSRGGGQSAAAGQFPGPDRPSPPGPGGGDKRARRRRALPLPPPLRLRRLRAAAPRGRRRGPDPMRPLRAGVGGSPRRSPPARHALERPAVRDLLPVWFLEDMRTMEVFHWEDGGKSALAVPSQSFSCCQSSAPHLAMAVRYNRVRILFRILKAIQAFPPGDRAGHLDRRGCSRVEGGKTALHVACELVRPECLLLLLGHGASPCLQDSAGNTPLDTLLQQIAHTPAANDLQFTMKQQLLDNRQRWQDLLGENRLQCLLGLAPPSLFVGAMRVLIRTISPEHFPEALDNLPLPHFLKPLDLKLES
ncbi:ankyrin repeat domain-containing protein 9 [Patagioenas fasciata monilis]|uniref:Ankyrin repeat domain-containing protein 9 n=1 Tax=Patagioenas fasciata monilis TaxID=372326 RepID=A0A1V4KAS3_PATFA|nr:ankyrin repeat domain-containing protein 9 [Patagioenas fasciata monilis]